MRRHPMWRKEHRQGRQQLQRIHTPKRGHHRVGCGEIGAEGPVALALRILHNLLAKEVAFPGEAYFA